MPATAAKALSSAASPIPNYPSAALFQKPAEQIRPAEGPLFREDPGTAKAPG